MRFDFEIKKNNNISIIVVIALNAVLASQIKQTLVKVYFNEGRAKRSGNREKS